MVKKGSKITPQKPFNIANLWGSDIVVNKHYLNYHYMNTRKPRVAIYSRVSSAETKTKANGEKRQHVENQLGQLRTFAMGQGWEVIKEYVDHESGLKSDRPEFKNLLASASRHEFDIVLFWALDRFSREGTKKTLAYLTILENYNVGFRSFTEQYLDSTGIFKDAVIGIISAVANMESVRRGDRVRAGMARAKAQGKRISRPPLPDVKKRKILALKETKLSNRKIAIEVGVSHITVANVLNEK